jgi:hypothetical protein
MPAKDSLDPKGARADESPPTALRATRATFKSTMLANPNYFGTLPGLGFDVVEPLIENTSFEELVCLGLQPQSERLEAVVDIKQGSGYLGGACDDGSPEYVRFFVERSGAWVDIGVAAFTSHDLGASPLPVSYSLSVELDEARAFCSIEQLVNVRAILSWNIEPPPNQPFWTPAFGNAVESIVQIAPRTFFKVPLHDLIAEGVISIKDEALSEIDLDQTLGEATAKPVAIHELSRLYADAEVPPHRFAFVHAKQLASEPLRAETLLSRAKTTKASGKQALAADEEIASLGGSSVLVDVGIDIAKLLADLEKTIGDTTYEELSCAGYNPETGMLGAVLQINRSTGYSGGLCSAGSTEYVGFWIETAPGVWQALGVAQVQVHDLAAVASGTKVRYAVLRAANLPPELCANIRGIRLRAVLSWQVPPTGPFFDPQWGNVVDTHVVPPIGEPEGEERQVRLTRIGQVTISSISDVTGRAGPSIVAGDCTNGDDSPFGGSFLVEGVLTHEIEVFHPLTGDVLPGLHELRYQVFAGPAGGTLTQIGNNFNIATWPAASIGPVIKNQHLVPGPSGDLFYRYYESPSQPVNPRALAWWQTGGLAEGLYVIEVRGFAWNGADYVQFDTQSKHVYIYNGYPHIELAAGGGSFPAARPEVHLQITSGGGDCADFVVGDVIEGTYSVTDHFFGNRSILVPVITVGGVPQPSNAVETFAFPSGTPQPNPISYGAPQATTYGISGTWKLDTAGMTACGYNVRLGSWDRALVDNTCWGHYNETNVGFCLRDAK